MFVGVDHTELREGTRLPPDVAKISIIIKGLELVTGADLFITLSNDQITDVRFASVINPGEVIADEPLLTARKMDIPLPYAIAAANLIKACRFGMLIQRKTGRDLVHSVGKLPEIATKMVGWCQCSYILFVGNISRGADNMTVVDGKTTKTHYNAMQGMLSAIQERGAYYAQVATDADVFPWIKLQSERLQARVNSGVKVPDVRIGVDLELRDKTYKPWRATLMTFPGIGEVLADRIAEDCNTLTEALIKMSDPKWLCDGSSRPSRASEKSVREWRGWMGFNSDNLKMNTEMVEG